MRIALIGSGRMGQAVAKLAIKAGHTVVLANSRGPETLKDLVKELGPQASAAKVADAVAGADLVVLGTPWGKTKEAVSAVADWKGKIVVDGTNNRAGPEIFDIGGIPSSIVVAGYMPGARVVKAFNHNGIHVWSEALANKSEANALYVSGDDPAAKKVVSDFITQIGGTPIDAGDAQTGGALYGVGGKLRIMPLQMLTPAEARAQLEEVRARTRAMTRDWSIDWHTKESPEFRAATDAILAKAWQLVPKLAERAPEAEKLRRMPEQTIKDAAELWPMLVPKRWGGLGLGSRAICETARILAHGDASSAWALTFLIEHSHMACHLPWQAQEELFANRNYILASAPLSPGGLAVRVEGGYKLNGNFKYASGVGNSDWTFATAFISENNDLVPYTFLVPLNDPGVTLNDDWYMAGMAATSSASVTAKDVFVPERYGILNEIFDSADLHPGARHEESFLRYPPLGSIRIMVAAVSLGSAEKCIDLACERMDQAKMFNIRRIDLPLTRVKWATALQKVRAARLIYRDLVERMIAQCEACESWSEEFTGQAELDLVTIVKLSREAVVMATEGLGTSIFKLNDPVQRYRRDVDVMSSHLFQEYDFVAERASRVLLGLGYLPTDPYPTRPPKVGKDARPTS